MACFSRPSKSPTRGRRKPRRGSVGSRASPASICTWHDGYFLSLAFSTLFYFHLRVKDKQCYTWLIENRSQTGAVLSLFKSKDYRSSSTQEPTLMQYEARITCRIQGLHCRADCELHVAHFPQPRSSGLYQALCIQALPAGLR